MEWIGEAVVEAIVEREGAVGIVPAGVPVVAGVKLVEVGCGHKAGVLVPLWSWALLKWQVQEQGLCDAVGYAYGVSRQRIVKTEMNVSVSREEELESVIPPESAFASNAWNRPSSARTSVI